MKEKQIEWLGDSYDRLCDFPGDARQDAGYQLHKIQHGDEPDDWRPMKTVGPGVKEIWTSDTSGIFRVIYLATRGDKVLVLHCFQKKTQKTSNKDIELARKRLKDWKG